MLTYTLELFLKNDGSWAIIIAAKTNPQPENSLADRLLPEISHPPRAAKTLSRLITIDATAGSA